MKRFVYILLFVLGCKEAYTPPLKNANYKYLVVEGNILAGNDSTFISLSRTIPVADSSTVQRETNATIKVEGENGEVYQLENAGNGIYYAAPLHININENYRLHIFTADGKEYASDYVPVKQTPPVDSISWKQDGMNGVTVYANTHDAVGNTQYYQWAFVETWEHRVRYHAGLIYDNGTLRDMTPDEQTYRCWSIVPSPEVSISSTTGLSGDVVYEYPLVKIPYGNEKLSFVYSILVNQYALTKSAYEFWDNLKKNTEKIGSIFDPQPFADYGNMHCITNPEEPVLGFVNACSTTQQRIFINNSQLQSWDYEFPYCETDTLNASNPGTGFDNSGFLPVYYLNRTDLFIAGAECVDCKTSGGTNSKPPYMP